MGATLAFLGVKNCMPLMHGAQGCASFTKVFFTRHFNDPIAIQTTAVNDITAEDLGGAFVHTHISGVADHFAENETDAIEKCRTIFKTLKRDNLNISAPSHYSPLHSPKALNNLSDNVLNGKTPIKSIIDHIIDSESFNEFKANFGTTLITAFATIKGKNIGVIANNGILFAESAQKGAHFIQLCNSRHIPMLFLQNITGFHVIIFSCKNLIQRVFQQFTILKTINCLILRTVMNP
jgi:3-methylcrotonyl-CoA carboxylase beta subunit